MLHVMYVEKVLFLYCDTVTYYKRLLLECQGVPILPTTMVTLLHGPSMFAVKAKIYGVLYKQSSSIAFDETFSYWSAPKKLLISRLFIGHHVVIWFPLVSIS